ncbi:MAG: iron-containing alcohol dehydrogenase [Clostridia bacterium]|nr:iron-containing alcohol dehydrogenase [Clostridia bacterium]
MMHADFYIPTHLFFGENALNKGKDMLTAAGRHAMLVTGKQSARKSGALADVTALLKDAAITYTVFDGITENPPLLTCFEAGRLAAKEGAQFVIGIGGGSPLDAAKAIAAFAANPSLSPEDIFDDKKRINPALPIFAVPTTAGTGSEVNNYSVLTLPSGLQKKTFKAPDSWPRAAFVDPRYTATMSNDTTLSTALDAFAHAMESYLSPRSTLFSENAALFAAREIFDVISALPTTYDAEMRARLALAATAGGMAISVTGTGFPHPLGYSLTLLDGIPHGRACAVFAGDYITYNEKSESGRARIANFAAAIGAKPAVLKAFLPGVAGVSLSMTDDEIAQHVELIAGAKNYANSPYVISKEEIFEIYRAHFKTK